MIHRLVHDVTRHRPSREQATGASQPLTVIHALLRADLPAEVWATPASWPGWRALLPSVLAATIHDAGAADGANRDDTAWLLTEAGTYLESQGRYAEALPLHQRALRIDEAVLGPDHPDVATDLNYVGGALSALGRR